MKRTCFFIFLTLAATLMPAVGFSAEADVKDALDKTPAAAEASKNPPAGKMPQNVSDDFAVSETKAAPVATVSSEAAAESATVATVKAEPVKTESVKTEPAPVKSSKKPEKKVPEKQEKKETSSALNPADLQRRWKALFSKEVGPDSIAYTVKSGDSLYVLARKNHTTVDLIKKINGLTSDNIYPKMKLKILTAPFSIQIDKSKNVLVLYLKDEAVKRYSVATGKKNCTPVGEFKITDKLVNPTWFKTGAILPPGSPENALGTRWMGFDKPAYGIHGTIDPKSIGTQASEGCIRMLNEEVEELYSIVPVGTKVTIQD